MPGPLEASASAPMQSLRSSNPAWPGPHSKVLAVLLQVDSSAQTVSLSTTFVANPAVQPFVVTPSTAVISGNGSARFTVAFSSADAMMHEGYLLSAQSVIAPESRVALHCTVSEEAAESAKDGPAPISLATTACVTTLPAEMAEPHVAIAANGTQGSSSAQTPLVTCQLSGGFHSHAGPPTIPLQPLKVSLHAEVIQPRLEPEFADTADSLRFVCHATDNPSRHPSYGQTMVLTNMHSCPLQFAVSMAGAEAGPGAGHFRIARAACSSVSKLEGLQPKPLLASLSGVDSNTKSMQHDGGVSQGMLTLAPHEHVSVYVQYMPLQAGSHAGASSAALVSHDNRLSDAQSAGRDDSVQDESASDQLIITYSNGYRQAVAVHAQRLHPVLEASAAQLNFGSVHMQSPKTLQLEFSNPSFVAADWSTQIQSSSVETGTVAAVSFENGGSSMIALHQSALPQAMETANHRLTGAQPSIAIDAAFGVSPSRGLLPGRGLAMPNKQKVLVTFAPKQLGVSRATLQVFIAEGIPVEVALSGEGTYSEAHEVQARLQNI
ncbi:hypothetical protein ABBQ32_003017 [Trebouxia sp. C0010 RCD-2024]